MKAFQLPQSSRSSSFFYFFLCCTPPPFEELFFPPKTLPRHQMATFHILCCVVCHNTAVITHKMAEGSLPSSSLGNDSPPALKQFIQPQSPLWRISPKLTSPLSVTCCLLAVALSCMNFLSLVWSAHTNRSAFSCLPWYMYACVCGFRDLVLTAWQE